MPAARAAARSPSTCWRSSSRGGSTRSIEEFEALMPFPTERVLELVGPERYRRHAEGAGGREDPDSADAGAAADLQRVLGGRRRHRGARLRELRHPRRLRAARQAGRRREGQDRHRPLRPELARHQAEGRVGARRGRLHHLLRSARRRVFPGRRVPGGRVPARAGRAARQRDGHADPSRRSAHAGLGVGAPAAGSSIAQRGEDAPEDSGAADLVRRRAAAAAKPEAARSRRRAGAARCRSRITSGPARRRCI